MKTWKKIGITLALFALPLVALGDVVPAGSTLTAQSATRNDAVTCISANGTAQQTVTMSACGPGQSHYITGIWSEAQATTAPAASAITTTTTNLNSLQLLFGLTATAGVSGAASRIPSTPIKAVAANTATTVVSNPAITSVTFQLTACYYCAP